MSGRKRADGGRSSGGVAGARPTAGGNAAAGGATVRRAPKKRRVWLRVTVGVVAALVLVAVAVFSWHRWLRFDDARDFQGTWYVAGTAAAGVYGFVPAG